MHGVTFLEALMHRGGTHGLDAPERNVRRRCLDGDGQARRQPPASHRRYHRSGVGQVFQHLKHAAGVAGHHVLVVERMHEGEISLLGQPEGLLEGLGGIPVEDHFSAVALAGQGLRLRGRFRHDNGAGHPHSGCGPGHSLSVVTRRDGNDASLPLVFGEGTNPMQGTSNLEGAGLLKILALQIHRGPHAPGQGLGPHEGRPMHRFGDFCARRLQAMQAEIRKAHGWWTLFGTASFAAVNKEIDGLRAT
jgi:hypothetical protein